LSNGLRLPPDLHDSVAVSFEEAPSRQVPLVESLGDPLGVLPIVPMFDLRGVELEEFSERRFPVPLAIGLPVIHGAAVAGHYKC
jgi:hypothetical protein